MVFVFKNIFKGSTATFTEADGNLSATVMEKKKKMFENTDVLSKAKISLQRQSLTEKLSSLQQPQKMRNSCSSPWAISEAIHRSKSLFPKQCRLCLLSHL